MEKRVKIRYTNWRGETADRVIVPEKLYFGSTEWHKEPGWLLRAFDEEKQALRDFSMGDIHSWQPLELLPN